MKFVLFAFWLIVALPAARASELERFWKDFPGFRNTLASYGYDRTFSASAQPEFVDEVVRDVAARPSKKRLAEYLCVLYYMPAPTVPDRLVASSSSQSARIRRTAGTIQKRLEEYGHSKNPQ